MLKAQPVNNYAKDVVMPAPNAAALGKYGDYSVGNLTADPNKGITNIVYNHLNLPTTISFTNNRSIGFMYDAGGNKLRKTVVDNGVTQYIQDYVGGIEYRTASNVTSLEAIYHSEGRVTTIGGTLKYEYALKDHLGNTRLMFCDKNANGVLSQSNNQETTEVTQENSYYSFGLNMEGVWMNTPSVIDNKYTYNGKELNDDFGLGWSDYGFRFYDAAIGRFPTIDLLSEIYFEQSPYVYAANNAINLIDFMGLGPDDPKTIDGGTLETVTVTAKRLVKDAPKTNNWILAVENSFDRSMGMTPNQYQNPYKSDEQRASDIIYAQRIGDLAEEATEDWLMTASSPLEFVALAKIERLYSAYKKINKMRHVKKLGKVGEKAAKIKEAKKGIKIDGIYRFPDELTKSTLREIKNVKHLSYTKQLRAYAKYAKDNGIDFILETRTGTTFSKALQKAIDEGEIIHRIISGL